MVGGGGACGMGGGESGVQPWSTRSVAQFAGEEGVLEYSTFYHHAQDSKWNYMNLLMNYIHTKS